MSDFYSILKQSIIDRGLRSARDREAAYSQARTAMVRRLWSYDPPLSEDEIDARIGQFDRAVDRIEDDLVEVFAELPEPAAAVAEAPGTAVPVYGGSDDEADYAPAYTVAPTARSPEVPGDSGARGNPAGIGNLLSSLDLRSLAVEKALNGDAPDDEEGTAEETTTPYDDRNDDDPVVPEAWEPQAVYPRPVPSGWEAPLDPDDPPRTARSAGEADPYGDHDDPAEDDMLVIVEREAPEARRRDRQPARERPAFSGKAPAAPRTRREQRRATQVRRARQPGLMRRIAAGIDSSVNSALSGTRGPVMLGAAVGLLGIGLAGFVAWMLWPSSSSSPPQLVATAPPLPPAAAPSGQPLPVAAARLPASTGAQRYMVFDGGDPTVFEADPSNPVRFDGSVARVSTSAGSAGARVLVGPGLAARLAGHNIRLSIMVRSARENGAASLRVAYQSGLAVSHWQTVNLSSEFGPLELIWRVPALRTDPAGNTIIIEPGIPGDGTAAEIGAIAIDLLD